MKNNVWLSADFHAFHDNIIKYSNRPFKNVEEMNATLLSNWNSIVGINDLAYILGDFSLGKFEETVNFIGKMNGNLVFLRGDHDYWMDDIEKHVSINSKNSNEITIYDNQIHEITYRNNSVILCHYAMRSWRKKFHGSYHFFGHSHGRLSKFERSMDVGVDTNNFFPITIGTAIDQIDAVFTYVKGQVE